MIIQGRTKRSFTHGISKLKLLMATEWAGDAFMVAVMMTMEARFKLFIKVCKRWEKNSKKNVEGEDDVLSCLDETGSNNSSGLVDTGSDSNEESHDDENYLMMKST